MMGLRDDDFPMRTLRLGSGDDDDDDGNDCGGRRDDDNDDDNEGAKPDTGSNSCGSASKNVDMKAVVATIMTIFLDAILLLLTDDDLV